MQQPMISRSPSLRPRVLIISHFFFSSSLSFSALRHSAMLIIVFSNYSSSHRWGPCVRSVGTNLYLVYTTHL